MQHQWLGAGQASPDRCCGFRRCSIHQKAGAAELPCCGQLKNGRVHSWGEAQVIGMDGGASDALTLMQRDAGSAVPDQSVEHGGREHQHHGWRIQQWKQ